MHITTQKSKNFNVTVYKKEKKFLLRDAVIDFVFLCSNYQRVVVSYQVGLDHKLSLKQIAMYKMAEDDYRNTLEIIKKILEVDVVSTENYKVEKIHNSCWWDKNPFIIRTPIYNNIPMSCVGKSII